MGRLERLRRFGNRLGPHLLLEILLPGGTLFALLLFLYQHGKASTGSLAITRCPMMSEAIDSTAPRNDHRTKGSG
jgi:hypothetical protein